MSILTSLCVWSSHGQAKIMVDRQIFSILFHPCAKCREHSPTHLRLVGYCNSWEHAGSKPSGKISTGKTSPGNNSGKMSPWKYLRENLSRTGSSRSRSTPVVVPRQGCSQGRKVVPEQGQGRFRSRSTQEVVPRQAKSIPQSQRPEIPSRLIPGIAVTLKI